MSNEIVTKKCTKCNTAKPLSEFNKKADGKNGVSHQCRCCSKKSNIEYYRSKNGIISKLYMHQKENSKRRKMRLPTYSKQELKEWLFSQELFHTLYDNWKRLDYQWIYVPSVDRKNDYLGYTLDNIQLMTWGENKAKSCSDIRNGINNKQSKAVLQFSKIGEFIAEYHSIRHAERMTGVANTNIGRVCKNKARSASGFRWKYKV